MYSNCNFETFLHALVIGYSTLTLNVIMSDCSIFLLIYICNISEIFQIRFYRRKKKYFNVLFAVVSKGTFLRLYYPCTHTEGLEKPEWIPSKEYFNGLADFMKINRAFSERIFNYLFGK